MDSIRTCYADAIDQYLRAGIAPDEPLTLFFDALDSPLAHLKLEGHFVSPNLVLTFLDREGITPVVNSRKPIDKMMVELWVTAIYALSLAPACEYYVRPIKDDPPDTELLIVDPKSNIMDVRKVEVTQYGRYSAELTDVIAKKLTKRYAEGTVLLVLVEETLALDLARLYEFIQRHNPHRQELVIIGGAQEAGEFKVVPMDEVATPASGGWTWMELKTDADVDYDARNRFDGVVFEPPPMSRFRPQSPVFVKSVALRR